MTEQLQDAEPNQQVLQALAERLHSWDHLATAEWAPETEAHSPERRAATVAALGFNETQGAIVNAAIPRFSEAERAIVIAERHHEWYFERKHEITPFYWEHYANRLRPIWKDRNVDILEESIEDVLSRLSDPTSAEIYPVKGLVMGYVQSGKTSHFMGLIAKAVDAGYRFIIILAGTLDILRRQTQRRVDRDLVGRELLDDDEYGADAEWDSFVSHGGRPSTIGSVDWERLTNSADDYRSLKQLLSILEFKRTDPTRPFNHVDNLRHAAVKLVVLKKTPSRLTKLSHDLARLTKLRSALEHVPTLVIDDESDQASVNTIDQTKPGKAGKRTSTNREIGQLLKMLPRAQYVGYTATPFANVFIDPADAEDLFPRDFIISLPRPAGYMGVADFYDSFDVPEADVVKSNRLAYIRPVRGVDADEGNLPAALDSFVLAGAIKLYREQASLGRLSYRHHTMLVHNSARVLAHKDDRDAIAALFRDGARYQTTAGAAALRQRFQTDFRAVSQARGSAYPFPSDFDELRPHIAQCLTKICDDKAIRIVNGERSALDDTPAFDEVPVWAVLVGGTKLSRGYTVEGLTVSYYRRPTGAGDTLMQMGRWFGFRPGYGDLVRVFLGSAEPKGKSTVDLYEAFGALCRDEEALRGDLMKYKDGGLLPRQVPPLVHQHLLTLPPTSKNKMFNAEIATADFHGEWTEKTLAPQDSKRKSANLGKLRQLLEAAASPVTPIHCGFTTMEGKSHRFEALVGQARGEDVVAFLDAYRWSSSRSPLGLEIAFVVEQGFSHWTLLLPQVGSTKVPLWPRSTLKSSPIQRSRASNARFGVYSEPRHRAAAAYLSGVTEQQGVSPALQASRRPGSPTLVLYLVESKAAGEKGLSVGFGIQYPGQPRPKNYVWTVRDHSRAESVVID